MYVNFLSTYSDKKSCHTSTTLQTGIARFVSDLSAIAELLVRKLFPWATFASEIVYIYLKSFKRTSLEFKKSPQQCNILRIMGCTVQCRIFLESSFHEQHLRLASQIVCVYLEPFRSQVNVVSTLKYLKMQHIWPFRASWWGATAPYYILLESSFHWQHFHCRCVPVSRTVKKLLSFKINDAKNTQNATYFPFPTYFPYATYFSFLPPHAIHIK